MWSGTAPASIGVVETVRGLADDYDDGARGDAIHPSVAGRGSRSLRTMR